MLFRSHDAAFYHPDKLPTHFHLLLWLDALNLLLPCFLPSSSPPPFAIPHAIFLLRMIFHISFRFSLVLFIPSVQTPVKAETSQYLEQISLLWMSLNVTIKIRPPGGYQFRQGFHHIRQNTFFSNNFRFQFVLYPVTHWVHNSEKGEIFYLPSLYDARIFSRLSSCAHPPPPFQWQGWKWETAGQHGVILPLPVFL